MRAAPPRQRSSAPMRTRLPEEEQAANNCRSAAGCWLKNLDGDWLAVVSKLPLERCSFAYECPLKWENLQAVEGSSTGVLRECAKNVFYSDSIDEAKSHARRGHCVAVAAALTRKEGDLDPPFHQMTMGILLPPNCAGRKEARRTESLHRSNDPSLSVRS